MDTLDGTAWDVVIAGTGLHESLLALALSRTGKKVLHVDKNDYYGGSEATLSLQEFELWVDKVGRDSSLFSQASISSPNPQDAASGLSFPRAYSLALAPQLLYARSQLLPALVSSRVDSQLEFLAMGSWWIVDDDGLLHKVPSGREELFASRDMTAAAKRSVVKFLRFVSDPEAQQEVLSEHASDPFDQFLSSQFGIAAQTQQQIHALVLSPDPPSKTSTNFALSRIAAHLRSIGVFGPGFGAVIPKWGGLAEVAQVGCRAGAVGGGVYVLDNGITTLSTPAEPASESNHDKFNVQLRRGEKLKANWIAGSFDNVPSATVPASASKTGAVARSITIVSSPLSTLFGAPVEGAPIAAGAVIVVPISSISEDAAESSPVYIIVHTSDTGECPNNQCVLYASHATTSATASVEIVDKAVEKLLASVSKDPDAASSPQILWQVRYVQHNSPRVHVNGNTLDVLVSDGIIVFPPLSTDVVFDDETLTTVREAWHRIVPDAAEGDFLQFLPRGEEVDVNEQD